jgi:tetratricopeptide (TPR) repeat protein
MRKLLALCLLIAGLSLKAQAPEQKYLDLFNQLDQISSYGDYNSLDSVSKQQINQGIQLCQTQLKKLLDSVTRSVFLYHKGRLELVKKNIPEAQKDLELAMNLHASNYPALERLCVLSYHHLKGYTKRKTYIQKSIKEWELRCYVDSTESFNWYYLGMTFKLHEEFSQAPVQTNVQYCLSRAIRLDSNNGTYLYELSLYKPCLAKIPLLRKALTKEEYWLYRSHILACYLELKQYRELLDFAELSLQLYEREFPNYYFFMSQIMQFEADAFKGLNQNEAAAQCLKRKKQYDNL